MPVAENNLVTAAEYRAAHLIESSALDLDYTDDELRTFIGQAAAYFETQCYVPIGTTAQVEILAVGSMRCSVDGKGALQIFPRFFPIQTVTEIAYRLSPNDGWTAKFAATDYSVEDPRIVVPFGSPFSRQSWGEVKVTYSSGYATIPADVKFAVILLTAFWASAGYAAVDAKEGQPSAVVPSWAWKRIDETIQRYRRRF